MIQVFTTGGTIDKVYFDAQSEFEIGDPLVAEILRTAGVKFPLEVETLLRKDSLEITDEDREVIATAIAETPAERVLITHGTDTMAKTAQVVSARLGSASTKTVVFVGSLTPARFRESDAEFNVGFAWAAVQTLRPGVYVAMNGQVFDALSVRKNRAQNRFEDARTSEAAA
ncbi:asparaginase domain-containing protein [Rubricoccus marinus]|uniref:Asparaginase n=1 Tax=Rubricoccus marinus TaxID=716817 RepID=A0A259TXY2_9BACT|nr:asparaginase domain-containing protein [Rubricoccus marinus]OZC02609.1 asparaginase [Rubricoccus marinus]